MVQRKSLCATVAAANKKCGAFPRDQRSPVGKTCEGINQVLNTQWAQRIRNIKQGCQNEERYPVYSQSHFYIRQDELGLVDPKSDAGLYPNLHRYGEETWDDTKQCIELLSPSTNTIQQSAHCIYCSYRYLSCSRNLAYR
jgi:hypothetical protein